MDTFFGKYKATSGGGSICGTDSSSNRKTLITVMIDTMKAVWDIQVSIGVTSLVTVSNFDTMWTAIKANTNFDVTTSDSTAYTMISWIDPTSNFTSSYRSAGNAAGTNPAKTDRANIATTYNMITQMSYKYEFKADNALDENGNATQGENLMDKLYDEMKSITWTGLTTNGNCATEHGRTHMGTVNGAGTFDGTEMEMMCDHWAFLTKRYYLNSSVTDNSADWASENAAVAGGDLSMTDWKKWYYTNKAGWNTTGVSANDGGKALVSGDDYYDGGNLTTRLEKIYLAKVEQYDDKARSGQLTSTSLVADWTTASWGLYAKQSTNWNVNSSANSTHLTAGN